MTDVPLLMVEIDGYSVGMFWSILTVPPPSGLTFTVSLNVAPPQAASAGFGIIPSDTANAIKSAVVNILNEVR